MMDSAIYCRCGKSHSDGYTNLATDGREWWVCANCHRPTKEWLMGVGGTALLNFFKGGPIDGYAYETATLIASPHEVGSIPIEQYKWTDEVITSEKTGKTARVWVFKEDQPVTQNPAPSTDGQPTQNEGVRPMAESQETSPLEARRKELKLPRSVVSEQAGISQAKLARIEKGGPRTTDEEIATVTSALDALEQSRAGSAEAADPS